MPDIGELTKTWTTGSNYTGIGMQVSDSTAGVQTVIDLSVDGKNSLSIDTSGRVALGEGAVANNYGQFSYAAGNFNTNGDAQTSTYLYRGETTGDQPVELFIGGNTGRIEMNESGIMFYKAYISAASVTGGWQLHRAYSEEGFFETFPPFTAPPPTNPQKSNLPLSITHKPFGSAPVSINGYSLESLDDGKSIALKVSGGEGPVPGPEERIRWLARIDTIEMNIT
jgi:hypothetical protein